MATPYDQWYLEQTTKPTSRPLQTQAPNPFATDRDVRLAARQEFRDNRSAYRDQNLSFQDVINMMAMSQQGQANQLSQLAAINQARQLLGDQMGREGGIRESRRNPGFGETLSGIDWLKANYNPPAAQQAPQINPFDLTMQPSVPVRSFGYGQPPANSFGYQGNVNDPAVQMNQVVANYRPSPANYAPEPVSRPAVAPAPEPAMSRATPAVSTPSSQLTNILRPGENELTPDFVLPTWRDEQTKPVSYAQYVTNNPSAVNSQRRYSQSPFVNELVNIPETLLGGGASLIDLINYYLANPVTEYFTGRPGYGPNDVKARVANIFE